MAEKVSLMPRDEEEIQNNNDEDPFQNCDAMTAPSSCPASPLLASLHEGKGSSAVPEGLSVLSSLAMAQEKAPAGPEIISGDKAQSTASGFSEYFSTDVNMSLGGLSHLVAVYKLESVGISSPHSESLHWDCSQNLEESQLPRVSNASHEPQTVTALLVSKFDCCHAGAPNTQHACSSTEDDTVPCSLGEAIWMKTTKVMETLEKRKKEEKEKYRLQLAMYRRLLLLRSIRSLHKQLEQQQARLQECYGTVINTKKEVLKHIHSTSPSPSP
ncbi:UPF0500 protein C1orf216 homolog [Dromaius novaehollandiae]|uniref:UPF0500 protein C1orf216 homolog n=1 Tax=Dromaius novaehollandiae TaxID=8790 RepID=UPI000E1E3116|nr:UPF0500 protein C1orf216 homolog [Dromaius novaehollandiae]